MVAFSRDIPHTVSVGVDQASPHAASERSKMSTVIHSLPSPSPIEKPPRGRSLELVLTKAKARVANYIRNADGNGLDPFLMVVEDEFGDLVHTQGDLSFLMPSAPVLHQWFASQLNTEIKDQYDRRQLAVWQKMLMGSTRLTKSEYVLSAASAASACVRLENGAPNITAKYSRLRRARQNGRLPKGMSTT